MKKLLAALVVAAMLAGVALALLFTLLSVGDGEQVSGEAFVIAAYAQDIGQGLTCDDIREIVNPEGTERFPLVVAVVEAADVDVRLHVAARYLVSHMVARAKGGRPFSDEKAALRDIEDGYILYTAAVRDGLGVSEDEARSYLENRPPGRCEVTAEGLTETEALRTIQVERTKSRLVQKMLRELEPGEDIYQLMAARIAQERPSVEITEVAFGTGGELECTRDGAQVDCPSDLPTPEPTATPEKP